MDIQEYLKQFIENAGSLKESSDLYNGAVENIRKVAEMTEPLLKKDANGDYPPLDANLRKALYQAYQKATKSIIDFQDSLTQEELEQADAAMEPLRAINHLLTVDMHAMLALKSETQITYREFVAQSREVTLKLDGEHKTVGGVMSSRIPLSYTDEFGKVRKGLFTEARKLGEVDEGSATYRNLRSIGVDDESTVEGRNVVFSRIAEMFGIGKQVARAVNMTVEIDGEKKKGVFMDAAEGVDLGRLDVETVKKDYKDGIKLSNGAMKQLSDLQTLDFILGNKDRHPFNMIYDIKRDENGNAVLQGVTGIDNDYSLGTSDGDSNTRTNYSMDISDITFCSVSMAEKLGLMTDEMMLLAMQDQKLSQEEKEGALSRLHQVQEKLKNKEILLVNDDQWLEMQKQGKLDPPEDGYNLVYRMGMEVFQPQGLMDGARYAEHQRKVNEQEAGELCYAEAKRVEKEGYVDFAVECAGKKTVLPKAPQEEPDSRTYLRAYQALTKKESFFRGSTDKFKTMVRDLRALGTLCEKLPSEMSDNELSRYHNALVKLRASVDAYVDYKKDNLNGAVAEDRLRNARSLQEFVGKRVEALEASPQRLYRIQTADECKERVVDSIAKCLFHVDKSSHKLREVKENIRSSKAFLRMMENKDVAELQQLGRDAMNKPSSVLDRYVEESNAVEREEQAEKNAQPVPSTQKDERRMDAPLPG